MAYIVLILALYIVAAARLTRLLTADKITEPYRECIASTYGPDSMQAYGASCPWCVGMWISFLLAPLPIWLSGLTWWALPLVALTSSYSIGLLARLDAD